MAFRWRADDGPISVVFGSTHLLKKLGLSYKNVLDPRMGNFINRTAASKRNLMRAFPVLYIEVEKIPFAIRCFNGVE